MTTAPASIRRTQRARMIGILGFKIALIFALGSLHGLSLTPVTHTDTPSVGSWAMNTQPRPEPASAAQFVKGFAESDPEQIAPTLSPLYRDELLRRGITQRLVYLDRHHHSPPAPEPWLRFTYVDGMADEFGFQHLLYVAARRGRGRFRPSGGSTWRLTIRSSGSSTP